LPVYTTRRYFATKVVLYSGKSISTQFLLQQRVQTLMVRRRLLFNVSAIDNCRRRLYSP